MWIFKKRITIMLDHNIGFLKECLIKISGRATHILEIGGDIHGEVVTALAKHTKACVIGINPAPDYPNFGTPVPPVNNAFFIRGDGRFMSFANNSFDIVVSNATLEHVNGLEAFLQEVERVLKPKGLFYAHFGPIWSSRNGHHVYAQLREKEARFWKPGKNPIPDYGHLLMGPEEMRSYLKSSPCTNELIEPIIQWVYHCDAINRKPYEHYIEEFNKSSLLIETLRNASLNDHKPSADILKQLIEKYGNHANFISSNITVVMRKRPYGKFPNHLLFSSYIVVKRILYAVLINFFSVQILKRFPEIVPLVKFVWVRFQQWR